MLFGKKTETCGYELVKEGQEDIMRINCLRCSYVPSIADNALCMMRTIDKLVESPSVGRIIFAQKRNYEYSYEQTQMLVEIANLYNHLVKQKRALSLSAMGTGLGCTRCFPSRHAEIQYIVFNLLRSDPLGAYVELKRLIREAKIRLKKWEDVKCVECEQVYIDLLNYLFDLLGKTRLISIAKLYLSGYVLGERDLYRDLFRPAVRPNFMFTRLMAQQPIDGEELDTYSVKDADVTIFSTPGDIKYLYHVTPPEFKISEDEYELLDLARNVLVEHRPRAEEFLDPERMRNTFFNIGRDLLQELVEQRDYDISFDKIKELAKILVRYTIGFGLVEILLEDKKVQDIVINGPIGQTPIFIVHQDFDECVTNIIPSNEDGESWASKFRMLSGRPLDEANPVLDTELLVPGARARVAIMTKPLNPLGLAYAFRRHRDTPWTYPLFIENRMMTPLAAGLMSFMIDGARTILIAGTRSSGKTSLLGATLVEIMRKYRIITVEDSVAGDSELLIKRNGIFERTTIGNLVDDLINKHGCWYNLSGHEVLGNDENIELHSMDKKGKVGLSKVSKFVRHKVKKPVYEITTRTGRKLRVTGDHSLFGLRDKAKISEIKVRDLEKGSFIAVPRCLPSNFKDLKTINLIDYIAKLDKGFFYGTPIKDFLKKNKFEVKQLSKEHNYAKCTFNRWIREGIIPVRILKDMYCLGYGLCCFDGIYYKDNLNSKGLPILLELNEFLLNMLGLWIADGCYDSKSVIFSVVEEENRDVVRKFAAKYGFNVKMHSDGFSLMINSSTLKRIMREILDLKGNAYTKRVPQWMFNLSKKQISFVLKGIFSGDGCVADKEIVIPLASLNLLKDIQLLLLQFEVILRIGRLRKDKTYNAGISTLRDWILFRNLIGILPTYKKQKLDLLCDKFSTHGVTDVIPLTIEDKRRLCSVVKSLNFNDYVVRNNNMGRRKLASASQKVIICDELLENINILVASDLLWDQVREIRKIDFEGYVYDISVPENESFVTNNIIAHNTLELPTEALRELGYNIQPMKVRAALMAGGGELPADEGIRTSLRMGDSSLIIGEVRSLEAKALYEAMRIGALANVVAGTIHGASPYGVFDRVVNDLGVPRTSFKATDLIVVANPIKSSDGLHKWKRILQISEIRKHWEEDPLKEGGFVDLMKYDPKTDQLEPTDDLINGESEVLKDVAGNVREWAGDWDAVWDNILLRAHVKETLINQAKKSGIKELLESNFVVNANDQFHRICDSVKEEVGALDSKKILFRWEDWLKKQIKKKVIT